MMAEVWSNQELQIIVADYFAMLQDEIADLPYSKTEHRHAIQPFLSHRTDGSIEYKYQNISAVMMRLGLPWINGYKPAWNYQHALAETVVNFIKQNLSFEKNFVTFSEAGVKEPHKVALRFNQLLDEPPKREGQLALEPQLAYENPIKVNYLEVEQNNSLLGKYGEELVIQYEKWRLIEAGNDSLADQVEWVAQEKGDWLGYDILSRNTNGTDRYIEVKTTKLGKDAPIFFSKNEYDFAQSNHSHYHLYRLFNFNKGPRLFMLNGRYEDFCQFHAVKFKGYL